MTISGQGIWIWQLERSCGGDVERLVEECLARRFGHVLLKCCDGARRYARNQALDGYVAGRLRAQGVQVLGWGFHYGRRPEAEAEAAVAACRELGHTIYVCNAEREFETARGAEKAARFARRFHDCCNGAIALGLSTYALPSLHPRFPYAAFLEHCAFIMPQIYTVPSRRWPMLASLREYLAWSDEALRAFAKPVIPTLRAYTGDGVFDWRVIAADARDFLDSEARARLAAWNWWVWQSAETNAPMWALLREAIHV